MLGGIKLSDVIRSIHAYEGSAEKLDEFILNDKSCMRHHV